MQRRAGLGRRGACRGRGDRWREPGRQGRGSPVAYVTRVPMDARSLQLFSKQILGGQVNLGSLQRVPVHIDIFKTEKS